LAKRVKIQVGNKPRLCRGLPVGSLITCADNTGAKVLKIIAVIPYKSRLNRFPSASVGDMIVTSVKKGTPEMRRKIVRAVVVRQRKSYRRPDGAWVMFEDNAGVVVSPDGEPQGSEARGPVAKEAAERWSKIATIASIVI
jgi:large subunit ribosomal protein L14